MDSWKKMVAAQGGDPEAPLPVAKHTQDVLAETDGVLTEMDAMSVGVASWRLGAGRARQGDPVQAGAGVEIHAVPGERSLTGGATIDPDAADGTGAREDVVIDRID